MAEKGTSFENFLKHTSREISDAYEAFYNPQKHTEEEVNNATFFLITQIYKFEAAIQNMPKQERKERFEKIILGMYHFPKFELPQDYTTADQN